MKQLLFSAIMAVAAVPAYAFDYPTTDRVEYVEQCMRDSTAARYEMLYKCSCSIDAIAKEISYEDYVEASTAANAMSIGGERGSVIRDAQINKDLAGKFRAIQSKARKSCFIN